MNKIINKRRYMIMSKAKKFIWGFVLCLMLLLGLGANAFSAILNADIGVQGLACPFCAYGLEKKLEALGVKSLEISMNEGKAIVEFSKENVRVKNIEKAVSDAGFSTRYIRLTVLGKLGSVDGKDVLRGKGTDVLYLLKINDNLKMLKDNIKDRETMIKVSGPVQKANGQTAHYELTVENFEVES
jgi:copper chaperone CopZ